MNVEEIEAAGQVFRVATVQNLYNLANRKSEDVLDHCEENGIGFIPWFPLDRGQARPPRRRRRRGARRLTRRPGRWRSPGCCAGAR